MNIAIGTVLLWAVVAWIWRRLGPGPRRAEALAAARATAAFTLPRVTVALVGAGFFAELMPPERVEALFGAEAGFRAVLLGVALGPLTPGGAFVSFAIGAAALQAGAATAPVLAYVTAWSLFSLTRTMAYELPILGARTVGLRMALSWPIPLAVGAVALAVS